MKDLLYFNPSDQQWQDFCICLAAHEFQDDMLERFTEFVLKFLTNEVQPRERKLNVKYEVSAVHLFARLEFFGFATRAMVRQMLDRAAGSHLLAKPINNGCGSIEEMNSPKT